MHHRNLKDLIGEAIGECLKDICEDFDVERVYVRIFFRFHTHHLFNEFDIHTVSIHIYIIVT